MDESTNSKSFSLQQILVFGMFVTSLIIFIIVLIMFGQSNQAPNDSQAGNITEISDPFELPAIDETTIVASTENSVEFEVEGDVIEVMAEYLLAFSDQSEWTVVEPSQVPEALDYQEIVVQKGEGKQILLSVESLTEFSVRVIAKEM